MKSSVLAICSTVLALSAPFAFADSRRNTGLRPADPRENGRPEDRAPDPSRLERARREPLVNRLSAWSYRRRRADLPWTRAANLDHAVAIMSREDPGKLERAIRRQPDPRASVFAALMKVAGAAGGRVVSRGARA